MSNDDFPSVDDCNNFLCLSHKHKNRWDEALCSAKFQLAEKDKTITAQKEEIERLKEQLTSDEQELFNQVNTLRERVKELEEGISKVLMLPNFSIYYGEQFTKWLKAL